MKSVYQAYYTDSVPIVAYMTKMLDVRAGDIVLEPSAGEGAFVEALLKAEPHASVVAYDIDPQACAVLRSRFHGQPVDVRERDFLAVEDVGIFAQDHQIYDKVIGNPPYGGWQTPERRRALKTKFHGHYVKETYTLFLLHAVRLLKEGGRLSFIIPDTFLSIHRHVAARRELLTNTKIEEIALIPSSFFPGVSFGYSNLAIITLVRERVAKRCLDNMIVVMRGFGSVDELATGQPRAVFRISQQDVLSGPEHAFILSDDVQLGRIISGARTRVGDVADCVTGLYSGNDKAFLRCGATDLKRAKRYQSIDRTDIYQGTPPLHGLDDTAAFVPIVKGGSTPFVKPDSWYLDWSVSAVRHYKTDRKARFQNAAFYFKQGIAIPMVSSRRVSAALLDSRLFDQSIVGVFPHDPAMLLYLLAFFNSATCTRLLRTINPTANNSANYIKKIPLAPWSKADLDIVNTRMHGLIAALRESPTARIESDCAWIDRFFESKYGL